MTQVKAMFLVQQSAVDEADGHLVHRFGDVVKTLAHINPISDIGTLFYFGDIAQDGLPFELFQPPVLRKQPQLGRVARLVECLTWASNQTEPDTLYVLSIHADMFVDNDDELVSLIDSLPPNIFVLLVPSGMVPNDTLCEEVQHSLKWRDDTSILHLVSDEPVEPSKVTDHITTWHTGIVQPVG